MRRLGLVLGALGISGFVMAGCSAADTEHPGTESSSIIVQFPPGGIPPVSYHSLFAFSKDRTGTYLEVVDLDTYQLRYDVKLGFDPVLSAFVVSPDGLRAAFIVPDWANPNSFPVYYHVAIVDTQSGNTLATSPVLARRLSGSAGYTFVTDTLPPLAMSPDGSKLYVNDTLGSSQPVSPDSQCHDGTEILELDASTGDVLRTIPASPGDNIAGLAVSPDGKRIAGSVACGSQESWGFFWLGEPDLTPHLSKVVGEAGSVIPDELLFLDNETYVAPVSYGGLWWSSLDGFETDVGGAVKFGLAYSAVTKRLYSLDAIRLDIIDPGTHKLEVEKSLSQYDNVMTSAVDGKRLYISEIESEEAGRLATFDVVTQKYTSPLYYFKHTGVHALKAVNAAPECKPECPSGACGVIDAACGGGKLTCGCEPGFACSKNVCECQPKVCAAGYFFNQFTCQCVKNPIKLGSALGPL